MSKDEFDVLRDVILMAVGIATVIVYYRQLRVMSRQLQSMQDASLAQSTLSLVAFLQSADVRKARTCVREVLSGKPHGEWTPAERRSASLVAANYDVAAAMVKHGLASERLICSNWGTSILHCYRVLEPFILSVRARSGADPRYWENFQWLSDRSLCTRADSMNTSARKDDLQRFLEAQAPHYEAVLAELRSGRKQGHWMWFVFPQLRGLGRSANATRYGIADLREARDYLAHPVLGVRLAECVRLAMAAGRPAEAVFGDDAVKLKSCLTLFELASGADDSVYSEALDVLYAGSRDTLTLQLLRKR